MSGPPLHPLEIKHRVDTALDAAVARGATQLRLFLNLVDATIFAQSLGQDDCPPTYREVPVEISAAAERSSLYGMIEVEAGGMRWLL